MWWQHDDRECTAVVSRRKASLRPGPQGKRTFTPGYAEPSWGHRQHDDDVDKLVSIVDGLVKDLRQEKRERRALEKVICGKRRAMVLPLESRPAKRPSIASTSAGSCLASEEEESATGESKRRARRTSRGWASVLSTDEDEEDETGSQGPRNALSGFVVNKTPASKGAQGWEWPLSKKERRGRERHAPAVEDLQLQLTGKRTKA